MRSLIVLLLVVSTASITLADVAGSIATVKEIKTITRGRTRVVIRGELTAAHQTELVTLADQVIADVQRRFTAPAKTRDADLTLCLFENDRRYREVAAVMGPIPSDLGFYSPGHRVAIANIGRSIGNLRHELAHPLLGDDFPAIPAWLNEGIGSLYGTARWTKAGFEFLVNYRLRDVQAALANNTLPSLAALATSTDDQVRGANAMMWYGYARYVLLYVEQRGKLSELYAGLRAASGDSELQRKVLATFVDENAFRTWVKNLRWR